MTLEDLRLMAARGHQSIRFPVEYDKGKVKPIGVDERILTEAGAIWYQCRDDLHRTYLILRHSKAIAGD